jgi:hypothetical protein
VNQETKFSHICPDCGALLAEDTCRAIFDEFLVLEFSDPGYGEVHMLTVACFMIQHGLYSDEALVWIAQKLRATLEEGLPAEKIRRQAAREAGPGARTWKVTRQPGARPLPKIAWSMTIVDVAAHYQDAIRYCTAVTRWARSTLQEMQPLISKS